MIRIGDWQRVMRQMLPIKLRRGGVLLLVYALCYVTRRIAEQAWQWVKTLIERLAYTSQVQAMRALLNDVFDPLQRRIRLIDGSDGNVLLFGSQQPHRVICSANDTATRVIVVPQSMTTIGCDFVVRVPQGVDIDDITGFIKSYVFCGLSFRVEVITN